MLSRAQAALEYLMTYGWALILIVSAVSAMVFIFSSPAGKVVFSSSDPAKVLLKAGAISGNLAVVKLQNVTGGNIELTAVTAGCTVDGDDLSSSPLNVSAGSEMTLECSAPGGVMPAVTINYTDFAGLPRTVGIMTSGAEARSGGSCGDASCDSGEECLADCATETYCSDSVDNDQDGKTDCDDTDCSGSLACDASLFAYYDFDEGSGTTLGDSAGSNNGTLTNFACTTLDCDPNSGWVSIGVSSNAISFDGVNDYISAIQTSLRTSGNQEHSISLWFKTNASSTGPLLMFGDSSTLDSSSGADEAIGWRNGTGNLSTSIFVSSHEYVDSSNTYRDNQWHLLTSTLDSSSLKLYIDGEFIGENTNANTGTAHTYGSNPYIWLTTRSKDSSNDIDDIQFFSGQIEEVKIYNRALGPEEVCSLCNEFASCGC